MGSESHKYIASARRRKDVHKNTQKNYIKSTDLRQLKSLLICWQPLTFFQPCKRRGCDVDIRSAVALTAENGAKAQRRLAASDAHISPMLLPVTGMKIGCVSSRVTDRCIDELLTC